MLKALRKYINRKLFRSKTHDVPAEYHSLNEVGMIGFAYCLDSSDCAAVLKNILENIKCNNIPFRGIVVERKKNQLKKASAVIPDLMVNPSLTIIRKKDLGFLKIPDVKKTAHFFSNVFDMFICFNSRKNFLYDYISKRAKSKFTIGMRSSATASYSMVLQGECKSTLNEVEYVKQVFHYVKVIQTGGENNEQQGKLF